MRQRKAFYRQIIPEFNFARIETADIDIFINICNRGYNFLKQFKILLWIWFSTSKAVLGT